MATFTKDAQKPIIRLGPGRRNPRLSDGTTELEFSYPPTEVEEPETENASFEETAGGESRKQADTWTREVRLRWYEPSNFIPTSIREMLRGGGDRTRQLTYTHHRELGSQLPGVEIVNDDGTSSLQGHVRSFSTKPAGRDRSGTMAYWCSMTFKESSEVRP